jgi:phenylacetic acid degradation operon negative regulatory protein
MVERAWDLKTVGLAYQQFVDELRPVVDAADDHSTDEDAYAARFRLVHAWRQFLFSDPALPTELLPADWPGTTAAAFFDHHAGRLLPPASRYVDACLAT